MTRLPPDIQPLLAPHRLQPLDAGWRLARATPGACADPAGLAALTPTWHDAEVPGTVAGALQHDLDQPGDYDADDWWYQTSFGRPADGSRHHLRFEGLATIAQAWLNGTPILESRNMFVAHRVDVSALLRDQNELVIAFRSLRQELARRHPRPRWKTRLVRDQALRFVRTTLLGRIPAWTPAVTAVGPWGAIALESAEHFDISGVRLDAWAEGGTGHMRVRANVAPLAGAAIESARLRVGDDEHDLAVGDGGVTGDLRIPGVPLWWPHTHGAPRLLPCRLELTVRPSNGTGSLLVALDCGRVGFREVSVESDGEFRLRVNGAPVFCRGAVWTTADFLRLRARPETLRTALVAARDAGANMLRVGGTMVYESDEFYRLCDELGLLVWQDFMFANMDYPVGDARFRAEAEAEARHQVTRLASHPCVALWCGGSEVAQQAAMQGLPAEAWGGELFERLLPAIVHELHAGALYLPSTPWGGALPMHVATGVSHYYGVGAYRRPLSDLKAARVRFAAECLGIANLPDSAPEFAPHHPRAKARVPRDEGAGYDFEDIRDHYLRELFGRDPVELRAVDLERYHAVSRVVSGEVMARAYSEWRAPASGCGGALVWFHRDLWPGAGWGITAADGTPKSPYWYLKRAWTPIAVRLTDEGLDGLAIHVINETPAPLDATVEIEMLLEGRRAAGPAHAPVRLGARAAVTLAADAIIGHFTDATHVYRFGPAKQDVVAVRLRDAASGAVLGEDFHFPVGHDLPRLVGASIVATARWDHAGTVLATISSDHFLQAVAVECDGFAPSDNHFHLAPGREKPIVLTPVDRRRRACEAYFQPLNMRSGVSARAERGPGDEPDETR
ncbi:MAG: glycoside hydrolase family 2 protein [Gemmatimonadaceae bacterium]